MVELSLVKRNVIEEPKVIICEWQSSIGCSEWNSFSIQDFLLGRKPAKMLLKKEYGPKRKTV